MTNQDILRVALRQSALEFGCEPEDFLRQDPVITLSRAHPGARKYLPLPLRCDMVCYGHNVTAQVSGDLRGVVEAYLQRFEPMRCFETPALLTLEDALRPHGLRVCFMAEYFLPDADALKPLPCPFETQVTEDFAGLYTPEWSNALTAHDPARDVLGVGAYDGERLIGLAACSMDCETMWQIGVDVLPAYRRQGIAAALTSRLACEILQRGAVPFYCAAWSNIPSVRNAIRSGFRPAWVELTARDEGFVRQMNGEENL
ncbi:MAG: GNAT family N-acetyltransferase [Clostridia bacterium]|nr:GNAT family N-acetyltransferase [Clostridia bacterium]